MRKKKRNVNCDYRQKKNPAEYSNIYKMQPDKTAEFSFTLNDLFLHFDRVVFVNKFERLNNDLIEILYTLP
jgi:hypothetical protein